MCFHTAKKKMSFHLFTKFHFHYSICREEIEALSEIAHQINHKLNSDVNSNVTHQQSNESVDLDNLFAFLSEVTPNNSNNSNTSSSSSNNGNEHENNKNLGNNNTSIIDDIEETFHDLDVELENVLQQEMEIMENERSNTKCLSNAKMGVPSLPEPTTRPPPPPNVPKATPNSISNNSPMGLNVTDLSTEVIPLNKPPQKPASVKSIKHNSRKEEPIYEAVIPRHELPPVVELPEPIPNLPISYDANHKLRFVRHFYSLKIYIYFFSNKDIYF